jgi:thiamine biosynthesis lipoprotein
MDENMLQKLFRRGLGFYLIVLVFLLSGCEGVTPQKYPFVFSGPIMGTSFSIKASRIPERVSIDNLQELILVRLQAINQRMSTYLKDSELSLLNTLPSTEPQIVSTELYTVLDAAQNISQLSAGAFDVTVGPLVNLWGFGPDIMLYQAPKPEAITQLLAQIGYVKLQLNKKDLTVTKTLASLSIDLSALAKGYAVDEVARVLEEQGIKDYLVEIGGEIRLKGNNLQGKKWRIAIEKPIINKRELEKVLAITGIAMATSGDYRNFFEQDGQRFSHTIDPRIGYPITHKLASVTVLAESCMLADAWATALMVLGPEEAYKMAEKQQLAVFFIIKTEQGFVDRATPLFEDYIKVKQ